MEIENSSCSFARVVICWLFSVPSSGGPVHSLLEFTTGSLNLAVEWDDFEYIQGGTWSCHTSFRNS